MSGTDRFAESFVSLVGAGPGDPGLLTLRGLQRIQQADVIYYDALIPDGIRKHFPPQAETCFVGKLAGRHSTRQDAINHLLVEKAREGKRIVRLKGGDPFVFGRGGEEALELVKHGIPFEVVPGVSSLIGVPAYAGLPVTHRGKSCSLTLVTGHEDPDKSSSAHNWEEIALADTLVIFMGHVTLRENMQKLMARGVPPGRPVAMIQRGTWPDQVTVTGTVGTIADIADRTPYKSPTMFIIGDIVTLREQLEWFEKRPLFGRKILVTRSRTQASELSALIFDYGGMPIECPLIRFVAPASWAPMDAAITAIAEFDWLVFTSVNGVDFFFNRFFETGHDLRDLGPVRICTIGPATARRVEALHLRVALQPAEYVAETLAAELAGQESLQGRRILLPRADIARETLVTLLTAQGADVQEVAAYHTVPNSEIDPAIPEALRNGGIDMVTFASSSTVRSFVEMAHREGLADLLPTLRVASIGPITSQTVRESGLQVTTEAHEYTILGLVQALLAYYQSA